MSNQVNFSDFINFQQKAQHFKSSSSPYKSFAFTLSGLSFQIYLYMISEIDCDIVEGFGSVIKR